MFIYLYVRTKQVLFKSVLHYFIIFCCHVDVFIYISRFYIRNAKQSVGNALSYFVCLLRVAIKTSL